MSTRQEVERDCVSRLLGVLGRPEARLASPTPPAPDVHAAFTDGSAETFEVTEIHPDEAPGQGSASDSCFQLDSAGSTGRYPISHRAEGREVVRLCGAVERDAVPTAGRIAPENGCCGSNVRVCAFSLR
jgi:hypothetical protein